MRLTKDLGSDYEHVFVLVTGDAKTFFLVDLTYAQFGSDALPSLLQDGYMRIDNDNYKTYLNTFFKGIHDTTDVNTTLKGRVL